MLPNVMEPAVQHIAGGCLSPNMTENGKADGHTSTLVSMSSHRIGTVRMYLHTIQVPCSAKSYAY